MGKIKQKHRLLYEKFICCKYDVLIGLYNSIILIEFRHFLYENIIAQKKNISAFLAKLYTFGHPIDQYRLTFYVRNQLV